MPQNPELKTGRKDGVFECDEGSTPPRKRWGGGSNPTKTVPLPGNRMCPCGKAPWPVQTLAVGKGWPALVTADAQGPKDGVSKVRAVDPRPFKNGSCEPIGFVLYPQSLSFSGKALCCFVVDFFGVSLLYLLFAPVLGQPSPPTGGRFFFVMPSV